MKNDFNKLYDHINNNNSQMKEHIRFLLRRVMSNIHTNKFVMTDVERERFSEIIHQQTEEIYEFIKDKIK